MLKKKEIKFLKTLNMLIKCGKMKKKKIINCNKNLNNKIKKCRIFYKIWIRLIKLYKTIKIIKKNYLKKSGIWMNNILKKKINTKIKLKIQKKL